MIRLWLAGALVVALLGAWQGSLLHPIEHLDHAGKFVHLAGTTHDPDEEGGPSALCDAIAAVTACLGGSSSIAIAPFHGAGIPVSGKAGNPRGAPLLAYHGQAPPSLL